jgi:hypothetical protein
VPPGVVGVLPSVGASVSNPFDLLRADKSPPSLGDSGKTGFVILLNELILFSTDGTLGDAGLEPN